MSGTSIDGLDVAYCEFCNPNNKWQFKLAYAETINIPNKLKAKIQQASKASGLELSYLNIELGKFFGSKTKAFISKHGLVPDLISSHGQTIFHNPHKGLTVQLGSGSEIVAITGVTTVCDFRTTDVAMGGQGAPLVPIGDKLLFSEYDACLNLGGFANISFDKNGERNAFDICPFNILPNFFMQKHGKPYDDKGEMGEKGLVNKVLYKAWNNIAFYKIKGPKSLGWEFVEHEVLCRINENLDTQTILRTYYEHITDQLANVINENQLKQVLITGGGAFNTFVLKLLNSKTDSELVVPEKQIINYKEALIFAFIGLLRLRNENNILKSVTGAKSDHVGGAVYQ